MSTALAIGAVTAVLRGLLNERLANVAGDLGDINPTVTVLPPDLVVPPETELTNTLNLFLYQVTPNLGWRNVDYPARNSEGTRVRYPPLALDLHYLLSAYSQEPFRAEIMLGYSMQVLHEAGILPRNLIRRRLGIDPEPSDPQIPTDVEIFSASTLADQVEILKVTPASLSTEEISKLWAAFQTNYRPTVAYHVSVVLIESDRPPVSALPVRERRVFVTPFKRPVINAVQPQLISPGELLTIQGYNLRAEHMGVRFDGNRLETPDPNTMTDREISIGLPSDLEAGVKTVQVVHFIDFDTDESTEELREGFGSNIVPFILRPQITSALPETLNRGDVFALSVDPPVGERQRVTLLLGDQALLPEPLPDGSSPPFSSFSFRIPPDFQLAEGEDADDVEVERYVARIRVDGAESALQTNDEGHYSDPFINI